MRMLVIILIGSSVLVGAALTRGVTHALTHAIGLSEDVTPDRHATR